MATPSAPTGQRINPYGAYNFVVEITTGTLKLTVQFMECSGLDSENMLIEYREGTDQATLGSGAFNRKLIGLERYANVTLRRGVTDSTELWTWRKNVRDAVDNAQRADVTIRLRDEKHQPKVSWQLQNAWCSKLTGPTFNAKGNELAIETMELVCDRMFLIDGSSKGPASPT
jgi:phage tail-like protein